MLDVSGGFMYTLPRTPLRGGSKEKAKVSKSPSRLSRARQFSMHGLSEASGPQKCGTNGKPTMRDAGEAKEREEKGRDACRGFLRRRSSEELPSGVIHGTGESKGSSVQQFLNYIMESLILAQNERWRRG